MDRTTFRILDALSRDPGSPVSIHGLKERISRLHGKAYYKNIYDRVMSLEGSGILRIGRSGRSSLVSLEFRSHMLLDLLAEAELERKRAILEGSPELAVLIPEAEEGLERGFPSLATAALAGPHRNLRLNRLEILLVFRDGPGEAMQEVFGLLQGIGARHSIRMDALMLTVREFSGLLGSDELNPLRGMMNDKVAFIRPGGFWRLVRDARIPGTGMGGQEEGEVREEELTYNMMRFGYREMGTKVTEGRRLCLESVIAELLRSGSARRRAAAPVLIARNRVNQRLLAFLCRKQGVEGRLLGILKALEGLGEGAGPGEGIGMLTAAGAREEEADREAIKRSLEVYHGGR